MPGDYVEITMNATSAADPTATKKIANVYQFRRLAGPGSAIKTQIETAFQASIGAALLLCLNEDYQQTNNVVRFFDDALDLPLEVTQVGVGAITGARMPDYVTVSVLLKSAVRSRSGRGRKSLGPITKASTVGDELTSGFITTCGGYATALISGFTDASANIWIPVVKSGKPPAEYTVNPVTVVTYDVALVGINSVLGILKRRKVRV